MIIEMFPAKNGDSLLIRLDSKQNILIDMGYRNTYKSFIRNRLLEIKKEGQCIDLLIITHIDEDHIEGAIEFLKENGQADNPNIIEVKEIWHNSYRHLEFEKHKINNISRFENMQLQDIKFSNSKVLNNESTENKDISALQGSTLARLLHKNLYAMWNKSYEMKAINVDEIESISIGEIKIILLSPNTEKLKELSKLWLRKLEAIDIEFSLSDEIIFDDAYEMYVKKVREIEDVEEEQDISYNSKTIEGLINTDIIQGKVDKSKSNGASIAFIMEYKNKKLLFLGDAHEDIIIDGIEKYREKGNELKFDLVKVSHHGSLKNNFKWIESIKSNRYLFSTDGSKHKHPSYEVITKILQKKDEKKLYFNYPINVCNQLDNEKLRKKFNYSIIKGDGKKSLQIEVYDGDE